MYKLFLGLCMLFTVGCTPKLCTKKFYSVKYAEHLTIKKGFYSGCDFTVLSESNNQYYFGSIACKLSDGSVDVLAGQVSSVDLFDECAE